MWIKQNLNREQILYVDNVVHARNRQVSGQQLQPKVVIERFERTTSDISQEQLYLVAHGMKLLGEKYESTAGQWS